MNANVMRKRALHYIGLNIKALKKNFARIYFRYYKFSQGFFSESRLSKDFAKNSPHENLYYYSRLQENLDPYTKKLGYVCLLYTSPSPRDS